MKQKNIIQRDWETIKPIITGFLKLGYWMFMTFGVPVLVFLFIFTTPTNYKLIGWGLFSLIWIVMWVDHEVL